MLTDHGRDFGFETTLSGKTYVRLLRDLRDRGYRIHLFFLWIPNIDIALERVADRVRRGGHNVPRFKGNRLRLKKVHRSKLSI